MSFKLAWDFVRRGRIILLLAVSLMAAIAVTTSAEAQTFTVVHTFSGGSDGIAPEAGLLLAPDGIYGTTYRGSILDTGTVFRIDNGGNYAARVFPGCCNVYPRGANPLGALIRDAAGNLYGTTYRGGNTNNYGTIFKLDKTGKETVLHTFVGRDGIGPWAPLIMDSAGNLYGSAKFGGAIGTCGPSGCGTIFKLDTAGKLTVLYVFQGTFDGVFPIGNMVRDSQGNLYGIASQGGSSSCVGGGCGTLFKLDPSGVLTILHVFVNNDVYGCFPDGGLIADRAGNLYGTTDACGNRADAGAVFKLDPQGQITALYEFKGGTDGSGSAAPLIQDAAGNLYGTTEFGGDLSCTLLLPGSGCGTVFKLDTSGQETVLYRFSGGADGGIPLTGLVMDAAGTLYGTTQQGGDFGCQEFLGCGVVFEITTP